VAHYDRKQLSITHDAHTHTEEQLSRRNEFHDMALSADEINRLCESAAQAAQFAHAPYSRFRVGAAVLGSAVHIGANVEISSLGASLCAERAALAASSVAGEKEIRAIALSFPDAKSLGATALVPCGICLQWIGDLAPDCEILVCEPLIRFTLKDLFPIPFHFEPEGGSGAVP
jgi:cytidine deaminase